MNYTEPTTQIKENIETILYTWGGDQPEEIQDQMQKLIPERKRFSVPQASRDLEILKGRNLENEDIFEIIRNPPEVGAVRSQKKRKESEAGGGGAISRSDSKKPKTHSPSDTESDDCVFETKLSRKLRPKSSMVEKVPRDTESDDDLEVQTKPKSNSSGSRLISKKPRAKSTNIKRPNQTAKTLRRTSQTPSFRALWESARRPLE